MSFTPGPWEVFIYDWGINPYKSLLGDYVIKRKPEEPFIAFASNLSDANLIAAAPEIYELLKKAAPYVSICDDEMEGHGNAGEVFSEIKNLLRRIDGEEDHND